MMLSRALSPPASTSGRPSIRSRVGRRAVWRGSRTRGWSRSTRSPAPAWWRGAARVVEAELAHVVAHERHEDLTVDLVGIGARQDAVVTSDDLGDAAEDQRAVTANQLVPGLGFPPEHATEQLGIGPVTGEKDGTVSEERHGRGVVQAPCHQ